MVELNKCVNDCGSRQMGTQSSEDLQMEGVMLEVQGSHLLEGAFELGLGKPCLEDFCHY